MQGLLIYDIEKETGVDLDIILQALKQFYAADLDCYCPHPVSLFKSCGENGEWYLMWITTYYKVSDYKKTWALRREDIIK